MSRANGSVRQVSRPATTRNHLMVLATKAFTALMLHLRPWRMIPEFANFSNETMRRVKEIGVACVAWTPSPYFRATSGLLQGYFRATSGGGVGSGLRPLRKRWGCGPRNPLLFKK